MSDLRRRISEAPTWLTLVAAGLVGAMTGLGQAPWGLWPLTLVGLCIVAMMLDATLRPRRAAWLGWAFGAGYFTLVLFWITEPFYVDATRHAWMAPFALATMAGGLALFWGLAFGVAKWLNRHSSLALIVTFTAAELLRAYVFTGFPWGMIAYVWVDTPFMQLAAHFGPHGLNALTLALTAGVYHLTLRKWRGVVIGLSAWGAAIGISLSGPSAPDTADGPTIRLIQPNAPQHLKWDPEWIPVWFDRQIGFTSAEGNPDLIVWPETSVPGVLDYNDDRIAQISQAANGTPVIFGTHRLSDAGYHNTLVAMDGSAEITGLYDKFHLVPFGEYVPGGDWIARIGLDMFSAQLGYGYASGEGPKLMDLGTLGLVQPLICYEAVFPQDVNQAPAGAEWMLQVTNDAWFGTRSGPYQHLVQAQFRAVEQGLPMVRVANTGVSAVIDSKGRVIAQLPLNASGFLDETLPPVGRPTLYGRTGDLPVLLLVLALMAVLFATRGRNNA